MILSIRQHSANTPWSSHDIPGHSVGKFIDDAWRTEAHDWDVYCVVSYSTVSYELCALNQFYYDLHGIRMSVDSVTGFEFALPREEVSNISFL